VRRETDTLTSNRGRNGFEDENENEDERDWGTIAGKEKRVDEREVS
jgi:hypothetical protein